MADPFSLETPTLRDILIYIDQQLARNDDDYKIAYSIAGLYSLPNIDRLRDDADLEDVLGLAGSLEIPRGSKASRDYDWRELRASLDRLRARIS
jgi:hypothetical protein